MVKIAIVIYSTYGHVLSLSKAEVEGVKAAGAEVEVFQLPSAEPNDASASADLPVITPSKLAEFDGVIFGIPSRYGTHPYAFKAFIDATGAQWATGAYHGKFIGFFVTSGTQGGGQESVVRNSITIAAHHGFIFVPLGYARAFGELTNLEELHGGSPWGAGSFAGPTGTRQPSKTELDIARIQGKSFAETVAKSLGQPLTASETSGATSGATTDAATTGAGAGSGSDSAAGAAAGAGAGAAGLGAAGAAAASKSGSGAAGSKEATSGATSGAEGIPTNAKDAVSEAKGAVSGAEGKTGAAGAAPGGAAGGLAGKEGEAKDLASNVESKANTAKDGANGDLATKAEDATGTKGKVENAESAVKDAKNAPQKGEANAKDAAENAEKTAEKEMSGCCACQ